MKMNINDLIQTEESNNKEFWVNYFNLNNIPFPSTIYNTFDEWKNEFIERQNSTARANTAYNLLQTDEFTRTIYNEYKFKSALKLLDYCDVEISNWVKLCDNVDDDFFTLKLSTLIVDALTIIKSDAECWDVEYSIRYKDEPVLCAFNINNVQLNQFLFQCYHKNIIV